MPQGQFPTILAGTDYTAALIQSLAIPWAYKASDTSRASTTTLANDPDLFIAMAANAQYMIVGYLIATGAAISTGDLQVAFTAPTGGTYRWSGNGFLTTSASTVSLSPARSSGAGAWGVNGSTASPVQISGFVTNSGTAGNFQLQWCQNTSNATATVLKAQSWLAAIRVM